MIRLQPGELQDPLLNLDDLYQINQAAFLGLTLHHNLA